MFQHFIFKPLKAVCGFWRFYAALPESFVADFFVLDTKTMAEMAEMVARDWGQNFKFPSSYGSMEDQGADLWVICSSRMDRSGSDQRWRQRWCHPPPSSEDDDDSSDGNSDNH